jgi:PAS domain S-box-containing protein
MSQHRPLSLRWQLLLVLGAVTAPAVLRAAWRWRSGAADADAWLTATLVLGALGLALVWLVQRRIAAFASALVQALRALGRGERAPLPILPLRELDDVARAVESAAAQRREAESRLREREARLTALLESAQDAVLVVDRSRRIVLFNAAAAALLGCPPREAVGRGIDRFVSGHLKRLVEARLEGVELVPARAFGERAALTVFHADGREVTVEASLSVADTGGERVCALIMRDVTERSRVDSEHANRLEREQAARVEAEAAAREAALLAEASRMLTASLDNDAVLTGLARLTAGALADWCVIDLVDDDGEVRRVAVVHADAAREPAAAAFRQQCPAVVDDPETVMRVLDTGEAVLLPEVSDRDLERRARGAEHLRLLRALGMCSVMVVPFVARGRTLGAMTLVRAAGAPYAAADLAAARQLADRAAIALDNGQLFRRAQEAHARFLGLVDGLDAIVWEADPTTLGFSFVSQRAESLLGYPLPRWTRGDFLFALVHPEDRAITLARIRECAATGEDCRLEHRALRADGRVLWLSTIVGAVRDETGAVERLHGVMIDVTERKRVEEERDRLLASEQAARAEAEAAARRAKFLAEASEALGSSLDYDATLVSVARLAVPTFADWCLVHVTDEAGPRLHAAAADPQQAGLATALERLVPSLDVGAVGSLLGAASDGEVLVSEVAPGWLEAMRLVQQLAPTSVIAVPLGARGRLLGSLVFVSSRPERRYGAADLALARDLAQRAAAAVDNARLFREAARANSAKDEFVATLSHELRTPLTAMVGWVHMLKSGRLGGEETAAALESIERNTQLQRRLIGDLLDVSRIVAGKLQLDRRPVEVRGVIEHALETLRREAKVRRLVIDWTAVAGEHWVLGDAVRLEQVVLNLLGNAVKFTPEGGRVAVRLEREASWVRVDVRDTGEGIEADALPHVFDTFHQGDSTSTRRHGGLGLGLAIVRHLVESHGGHGATFTVRLPVLAVADTPPAAPTPPPADDEPAPATAPRLDGVRALFVDDDADARRLVKAVLGSEGAEVLLAESADEALALLETTYVDVIVSDIAMPGSDGYALIERLRHRERSHGGRLPAIALTAYAGEEARDRALAAGFQHYVTKPITPAALTDVVARAVGREAIL